MPYNKDSYDKDSFTSLHISDLHLSNSLPYAAYKMNGITDRLFDQIYLMRRVYNDAEKKGVDAIFIQGDLFDHSRVDAVTLSEAIGTLRIPPAPVYLIAGNHDGVNARGERFTVEAFDAIKDIHYMQTGVHFAPRDWLRFWPVEFAPLDRTREILKTITPVECAQNVLLMHNSIKGCTHVGWMCDDGLDAREVEEKFSQVISGHFHDPQDFGERGMYLGAPLHHHFGDVGRRAGYWIMRWHRNKKVKKTFIDGGAPRFFTMDFELDVHKYMTRENVKAGDYLRIRIAATHAEMVELRPMVEAKVRDAISSGVHALWLHEPLATHVKRLEGVSEVDPALSIKKMIKAYVNATSVNTSGLDLQALTKSGMDILYDATN